MTLSDGYCWYGNNADSPVAVGAGGEREVAAAVVVVVVAVAVVVVVDAAAVSDFPKTTAVTKSRNRVRDTVSHSEVKLVVAWEEQRAENC